jgi:hypothetical protein
VSEFDHEPVRGLPGNLPQGETILWQGTPDWRLLARTALHTRKVAAYFALLAIWGAATGSLTGAAMTAAFGVVAVGMLMLFAWAMARSTVYTLTERRLVFRFGVALTKCINLPLSLVSSADLRLHDHGRGDVPLTVTGAHRLGWLRLWPHARPWKLLDPQPMLRAIPDAQHVAGLLVERLNAVAAPVSAPGRAKEALAA